MIDSGDSERYIFEAGQIVNEKDGRRAFQLQLDLETIEYLDKVFKTRQLIDSTLSDFLKRPAKLGFSHPDSMVSILRNKFKPVLEEAEQGSKITIELEKREVDYINSRLANRISGAKKSGSLELDEALQGTQREFNLNLLQETIPVFRDFSSSLAQIGEIPHPDALRMFDDLKQYKFNE